MISFIHGEYLLLSYIVAEHTYIFVADIASMFGWLPMTR